MQQKVIICFQANNLTHADVVVLSEQHEPQQVLVHVELPSLSLITKDKEVIVLVPSEEVLLTSITLPKLSRSKLQQALPFALEEHLVSEVEETHFAAGEYLPDGQLPAAVIAKQKMNAWLTVLREQQIEVNHLLPDCLALPIAEQAWYVVIDRDRAVVRLNATSGFACEKQNLATMLELQLAHSEDKPKTIYLLNYTAQSILPMPLNDCTTEELMLAPQQYAMDLARIAGQTIALDLLQGAYQPKRKLPTIKNAWFIASVLAVSCVALLFVSQIVSLVILQSRMSTIHYQVTTIYKRYFPEASSVVAPKERMQSYWNKQAGEASASRIFVLLADLGQGMDQVPHVEIQRLDFQHEQLTVEITAPSFEALDKLTSYLTQQGLKVQQQNAAMAEGIVKTNLLINAGGKS